MTNDSDNAVKALNEFEDWLDNEYENSGDDEQMLTIKVRFDELRTKYNVQR